MEVEPSTWYSSRVTLPSHDPAHWRLTSQPCLCSNHHSTWALPLRHLSIPLYFSTPLYLPLSFPPSISPPLSGPPLSISLLSRSLPLNLHPPLSISVSIYVSLSASLPTSSLYLPRLSEPLSPIARSLTPSLDLYWSKPPYLSTPISLSLYVSHSPLPLDLSPPPLLDLSTPSIALFDLSMPLYLSTPLYLPPLSIFLPSLSLPSSPIDRYLSISRHIFISLPLPPSPPLSSTLYISPLDLSPLSSSIWNSLDLYRYLAISRHLFISRNLPLSISPPFSGPLAPSFDLSPSLDRYYLSTPLYLPPSIYPHLSPPLSVPSRSFSWSLSIDAYLSTPLHLPLSPFSVSRSLHIYFDLPPSPLSRSLLLSNPTLDLSPLSRTIPLCRHLSPFVSLSLPPISISPLSYYLYRYLYFSTHLYIHLSPLAPLSGSLSPLSIDTFISLYLSLDLSHSLSLSIDVSISL